MNNRGEVVIGLLIGLAIGVVMLAVNADNKAQEIADKTGRSLSGLDVIAENPVDSAMTVAVPSLAGAGLGLIVDALKGGGDDSNSRDNNINVDAGEGDVNIDIDGDDQDNDTNEDNDENDQDNSGNTTGE